MDRRRVASGSPWEPAIGFSRALRVGEVVHVSGTGPVIADGGCPSGARAQAQRCFAIVEEALHGAGATLRDVVRTRMYVTDPAVVAEVGAVHAEVLGTVRPAATLVIVAALADPRWLVEIEAEAVVGSAAGP